jgi:hypothetical protein
MLAYEYEYITILFSEKTVMQSLIYLGSLSKRMAYLHTICTRSTGARETWETLH